MIERDMIKNSEYIIEYFYNKGKQITNFTIAKTCLFFRGNIYVCGRQK